MSDPPTHQAARAADELFDKYALPKVALAVILAASLVGTWLTATLGDAGVTVAVAKWVYLVALGVLTGGLLWKQAFVRPADLDAGAEAYCAEMYDRFDRIATGALVAPAVCGPVALWAYADHVGTSGVVGYGALLVCWLVVVAVAVRRGESPADQFRDRIGLSALALSLSVVAATAIMEVWTRGFDPVAAGVRTVHLLAFAVWVGGAVWNIFVAVPTGQQRPTAAVARAAGEQLERFRWAVRFVIPTMLLTGLYQAAAALGTAPAAYLASWVGLAVVAKVGLIGLLVAIFTLCPMWRACSPIDGVCDLEDLGRPADDGTGSSEEAGVVDGG